MVGVPYNAILHASGGTPTPVINTAKPSGGAVLYSVYTWSGTGLPAGLKIMSRTGLVTGIPSASAPVTFNATAKDSTGDSSGATAVSLNIAPWRPPTVSVTSSVLPAGLVGFPYCVMLTASGAQHPSVCRWRATSLPSWLTLDTDTGWLHGTPTATGRFSINVGVSDVYRGDATTQPVANNAVTLSGTINAIGTNCVYLSPTGDDTLGAGTLASPWSLTAIRNQSASVAGKWICLLPGIYRGGINNGKFTSLYNMAMNVVGTSNFLLNLPAGTASVYTTLTSVSSSGAYSPRTAIIDGSAASDATTQITCTFTGSLRAGTTLSTKAGYILDVTAIASGQLIRAPGDFQSCLLNLPGGTPDNPAWIMGQLTEPTGSGIGQYQVGPWSYSPVASTTMTAVPVATLTASTVIGNSSSYCNIYGIVLQYFTGSGIRYQTTNFGNVVDNEIRCSYFDSAAYNTGHFSGSYAENVAVFNNKFHNGVSTPTTNVTLAAAPSGTITQLRLANPWPFAPVYAGSYYGYRVKTSAGQSFYIVLPRGETLAYVVPALNYGPYPPTNVGSVTITGTPNNQLTVTPTGNDSYMASGIIFIPAGYGSVVTVRNNTVYGCQVVTTKDYLQNCVQVSYNYLEGGRLGRGPGNDGNHGYWIQGCDVPQYIHVHHNIIVAGISIVNMASTNSSGGVTISPNNRGLIEFNSNTILSGGMRITPGAPIGAYRIYNNVMPGTITYAYNSNGLSGRTNWQPVEGFPGPGSIIDYNVYNGYSSTPQYPPYNYHPNFSFSGAFNFPTNPPGYGPVTFTVWQRGGDGHNSWTSTPPDFPGYDQHSILTSASSYAPFATTPRSLNQASFALDTSIVPNNAGLGGTRIGALDGSGPIGCDF